MSTVESPREQKVGVKEMSWDPITRIVGSLGIHTEIDFANQQVNKCYSTSMVFRGFDIFMKGIDPRDTHFITSRICGICGDNHCTCSVLNQNMAYGVKPPPLGDLAYNLAESADYMFDHAIFNDCMANVDFCEQMVRETNPALLKKAEETTRAALRHPRLQDDRRHHALAQPVHRRLLPGDAAGGALHARDVLPVRRPPHPPLDDHAGRGQRRHHAPDLHRLLRAADALHRLREARRCRCTTTSTTSSSTELPGYDDVGYRRTDLVCWGAFDDPDYVDYDYKNMGAWGEKRYVTPGVVIDGELRSTNLVDINLMIRILLGSSYFDDWTDEETYVTQDPLGNPVDKRHPWNKTTLPKPQKRDWGDKYSWVASPRIYDERTDTYIASDTGGGPFARQWVTAKAGLVDFGYAKATGESIKMVLPRTASKPEMELEWKIPAKSNAIERDRARAYHEAYSALIGLHNLERALRRGAGRADQVLGRLQSSRRSGLLRLPRGGQGGAVASHGDPRREGGELPAIPADAVERQSA